MCAIRTEESWDAELQSKIAKYKTPRPSTYDEIEAMIVRFEKIGTATFNKAASLLKDELAKREKK